MSGKALEGDASHTYLDDLESFYYVMVYISLAYAGPGRRKAYLPQPLPRWEEPLAFRAKQGFLVSDFIPQVDVWFGPPFQNLIDRLHSVFQNMFRQKIIAEYRGNPQPKVNCAEIYDTMISHICQAIDDVGLEDIESSVALREDPATAGNACKHTSPNDGGDDGESEKSCQTLNPKKRMRFVKTTAAASRPRRRQANYGITKGGYEGGRHLWI